MKKKFFLVTTVPHTLHFFKGQIQVLKKLYDVSLVSSSGDRLYNIANTEGVPFHELEMARDISLISDLKSLFALFLLFRKEKPYIVHGNTPKGGLLSMLAACVARVPKRVYCIHGLRYEGNSGFKGKLLKAMERFTCFLATDIVAVSFGIVNTVKKDGVTDKKVNVIANGSINGIDSDFYDSNIIDSKKLRNALNISDGDLVFGFVGRLVKDKGTNELIEAFVNLNAHYPHIKLVLVGEEEASLDPLLPITKTYLKTHKTILCTGFQEDIRPYLKVMDVFVFPSYREGFGVSIMEAASMGIPAISSNIIGCNEIIKNDFNGKLIPSKSIKALEDAMELFIKNPSYMNKLASNSRPYIIEKYNQKLVWKGVHDFYKTL